MPPQVGTAGLESRSGSSSGADLLGAVGALGGGAAISRGLGSRGSGVSLDDPPQAELVKANAAVASH